MATGSSNLDTNDSLDLTDAHTTPAAIQSPACDSSPSNFANGSTSGCAGSKITAKELPASTSPQGIRDVVILGKTGSGKKTLANHIFGSKKMHVFTTIDSLTRTATVKGASATDHENNFVYNIKVFDTAGLLESSNPRMKTWRTYIHNNYQASINLVIFVFKNGRLSKEERAFFNHAISEFNPDISQICALVITNCESMGANARKEVVETFRTDTLTKDFANFMKKGIYTVGFPCTDNVKEKFRAGIEADIKRDEKELRDLVKNSGQALTMKDLIKEDTRPWKCPLL